MDFDDIGTTTERTARIVTGSCSVGSPHARSRLRSNLSNSGPGA